MDHKDAYIEQLENTIKELQNQVNNLTEMVLNTIANNKGFSDNNAEFKLKNTK